MPHLNEQAAKELIQAEVDRSSNNVVARRIGLSSHTVLTRWLKGGGVSGIVREQLIKYAETLQLDKLQHAQPGLFGYEQVRGARYVAEAFAEVLHKVLQEARKAELEALGRENALRGLARDGHDLASRVLANEEERVRILQEAETERQARVHDDQLADTAEATIKKVAAARRAGKGARRSSSGE